MSKVNEILMRAVSIKKESEKLLSKIELDKRRKDRTMLSKFKEERQVNSLTMAYEYCNAIVAIIAGATEKELNLIDEILTSYEELIQRIKE